MMRSWIVVVLLLCGACAKPAPRHPNIVFVLVDDLNARILPYLPQLQQLMPAKGMSFDMTVSTPLCAPSRATILTGRYAHNTTVKTNGVWAGGIWALRTGGNEQRTFGLWLRGAGYQTGYFGKYTNGYDGAEAKVPPGWDRWVSYRTVTLARSDFQTIEDGDVTRSIEKTYDTDFFAQEAASWVASAKEPFAAVWTPMSPHGPFLAAPRHRGRFADVAIQLPPSFAADAQEVTQRTRTRLEMMLSVDEGLAALIATLEKRGVLERTYIFFTSDHGIFMGEHGFQAGKGEPYEETTRVPLYVRGPGVPAGATSTAMVTSTDLAPTFAAIAGAAVPSDIDGRSFLPLLHGAALAQPRKRFLLEWFDPYGKVLWQGLRTADQKKYVRYADGSCKSFRLDADPDEMKDEPCDDAFATASQGFIDRLATCVGAQCAAAESE